jgi:Ni/Co efflux regulator RcnB
MTKTRITALAVLLLAGASGAALAQDRDQAERGQAVPQAHPQPQPHAGPPGGGHPGGAPHVDGGQRGPRGPEHGPSGGLGGQFHDRGDRGAQGAGGAPQRFDREAAPNGAGRGPGGAPPAFERRGEVIPPGAERGRTDARGAQFAGPRGAPQHWQAGRFPPVMQARDRFHAGYYRAPYGYYSRAWGFGDFLPRPWFVHDYWLDNFLDFGLPYPPPGYTWVRVGPDALMIDRFTGRIVQVVNGIFW